MPTNERPQNLTSKFLLSIPEGVALKAIGNDLLRRSIVKLADRIIYQVLKKTENPPGVKQDEWAVP